MPDFDVTVSKEYICGLDFATKNDPSDFCYLLEYLLF